MEYTICENMAHVEQVMREAENWHDLNGHFRTEREREAYRAGYMKAASDQRSLFSLHAKMKLS